MWRAAKLVLTNFYCILQRLSSSDPIYIIMAVDECAPCPFRVGQHSNELNGGCRNENTCENVSFEKISD